MVVLLRQNLETKSTLIEHYFTYDKTIQQRSRNQRLLQVIHIKVSKPAMHW